MRSDETEMWVSSGSSVLLALQAALLYFQTNAEKWIFHHMEKCEIHGYGFILYIYNEKFGRFLHLKNVNNFNSIMKVILTFWRLVI